MQGAVTYSLERAQTNPLKLPAQVLPWGWRMAGDFLGGPRVRAFNGQGDWRVLKSPK